ncbi:uncharacterized protein DNG_04599 [Cephalotrichum gorgonifer]|uniref:Heterokaryon incompatibility domain-containing protein n=1 Tax=Cephalotrichum gorgonifer TaxID=2041049 RepID=A0AAE8MWE4_9PEZI|nr:uncharacterized protein DNG_04599 [Cephalotrichum gorgonifer]
MDIDDSCTYCELVEDSNLSTEDRHRLFHQECDRCSPTPDPEWKKDSDSLCPLCKHLRLRHVLFCQDEIGSCEVGLGSFKDVESRLISTSCALCDLIGVACRMTLEQRKLKGYSSSSITLRLELLRTFGDDEDSFASIHLSVYDDDGDQIEGMAACQVYLRPESQSGDYLVWPLTDHNKDLVQPSIDWSRVKGWLSRCRAEHDRCNPTRLMVTPPPGFRVIDVEKRQLVSPPAGCRFIALSYVWGSSPDPSKLQTTISNVERLHEEGALEPSEVPAAINEAMQATRELGERYLWADRLCIVQDDPANKAQQIMSMGDIYSSAVLVLALCAGASTDDSIPGIGILRSPFNKAVALGNLIITTVLPSFGPVVMPSVWASRGWTYQEAALATRMLYFTPFQVIYECGAGHIYEDNFLNDSPMCKKDVPCGGGYQIRMPTIEATYEDSVRYVSYKTHVRNYNNRRLTYASDIYTAFAGALGALYGDITSMTYHGLPLLNFDEALLWYPDVEIHQAPPTFRLAGDLYLPTWSWVSVSGQTSHQDTRLSFKGSIVRWERVYTAGTKRASKPILESDQPSLEEWMFEEDNATKEIWLRKPPQLYMALAAAEGCVEMVRDLESDFQRTAPFIDVGTSLVERWPQYRDFRREAFEKSGSPCIEVPDTISEIDGPAIATRAQLASLTLGEHVHERTFGPCYREGVWLEILESAGDCIGVLAPSPSLSGWEVPSEGSEFEFIGISISSLPNGSLGDSLGCLYSPTTFNFDSVPSSELAEKLREGRHLNFTYWDSDDKPLNPIPIVNVMLIEREGGWARRVSIGWVLLTKWARLEKQRESIVLI